MRKFAIAIALSALPFAANAQQPTNLTLSCSGTWYVGGSDDKPRPVDNLGVIVAKDSVSFSGHTVPITETTSTRILFQGWIKVSQVFSEEDYYWGTIDRVTGEMEESTAEGAENGVLREMHLHCKPVTKMF